MEAIKLTHKDFLKIDKDYTKAAKMAELIYVNDKLPGIKRSARGGSFRYTFEGKEVRDKSELERIRKLAIPPAWTNVWICKDAHGHIQATGFDIRCRKQYRYHPGWEALRNETKFHRLYEFGKLIPALRLKLEEDFSKKELCEEKVIATLISVMERTYIRIGNNDYEKLYGSYGLTTLKDKHVTVTGDKLLFSFKGKKGVFHDIKLKNRRLAKAVKACRDIPGKELFQYYDSDGEKRSVDSGMVNAYIKEATGGAYTAKDFRTWAGTLNILQAFKVIGPAECDTSCKKNVVAALDEVSHQLGNTRTVCKKYYVHPGIIRLYEENTLSGYLKELDEIEQPDERTGYAGEEKILMKILKDLV